MLDLLRSQGDNRVIKLTQAFKRDLRWFDKFLCDYNGVSMYYHKSVDHTVELDACLEGLGAVWNSHVYHLPIPLHYQNLGIVHLEMVNILVATKTFGPFWAHHKVLIKCDNQAVVQVLVNGRTRDPFLATCARNIWQVAAKFDVELVYQHIHGIHNPIADLLSRWTNHHSDFVKLYTYVDNPIWLNVNIDLLEMDCNI